MDVTATALEAMADFAIQNNFTIDSIKFQQMAARLRLQHPIVTDFEYANGPNLNLSWSDPYTSALGLKLLLYNPDHAAQIMKAINNNTITMYGPFSLVEGGIGIRSIASYSAG